MDIMSGVMRSKFIQICVADIFEEIPENSKENQEILRILDEHLGSKSDSSIYDEWPFLPISAQNEIISIIMRYKKAL